VRSAGSRALALAGDFASLPRAPELGQGRRSFRVVIKRNKATQAPRDRGTTASHFYLPGSGDLTEIGKPKCGRRVLSYRAVRAVPCYEEWTSQRKRPLGEGVVGTHPNSWLHLPCFVISARVTSESE
jgi:hypothetical protein